MDRVAAAGPEIEVVLNDSAGSWLDANGTLTFSNSADGAQFNQALFGLTVDRVRSNVGSETPAQVEANQQRAEAAGFTIVKDSSIITLVFPSMDQAYKAALALRPLSFVICANFVLRAAEG